MNQASTLASPTSRLPSMGKVGYCTISELSDALTYLRSIYCPEVRGSRRLKPRLAGIDSQSMLLQADLECLEELRSDVFERSYAVKWLISLIAQSDSWISEESIPSGSLPIEREGLIRDAAALLAICSGTAAAGVIARDFVFRFDPKISVTIHIRDVPLDNRDYGSVGLQTWGGACVLAEMIVENPSSFNLFPSAEDEIRILELGAGTGLVSLTISKLVQIYSTSSFSTGPVIVATDCHSSVLGNLEHNIQANSSVTDHPSRIRTISHFLDWSKISENDTQTAPFDVPFDLILGADIVYEAQHALWIKSCLSLLLRRPIKNSDSNPLFHLVIPLRSTHSSESLTIETVFSASAGPITTEFELRIISKEMILCDAGSGLGSDLVEYAYYRIGWVQKSNT